jgi:hypothetical protein
MTQPPNSYYRVAFYVVSGQSLELATSTEPQRLNTGEIEATWTDNRHRRPHQLDRHPSRRDVGKSNSVVDEQTPGNDDDTMIT